MNNYENIHVNGFVAQVPTKPCICLQRIKPLPDWPFTMKRIRRKWYLFGELVMDNGFWFGYQSRVATWTDPECWRCQDDMLERIKNLAKRTTK